MNPNLKPTALTEAVIRSLKPADKPYVVRDTVVKGLMIAVNKRSKSYKVQRDLWVGEQGCRRLAKTVRRTLGSPEQLSVEQARTKAMRVIADIRDGIDPNTDARNAPAETWTVEQMYEEYKTDLRARECAERTITDTWQRLDRYLPDWKQIPIKSIKRSDCRGRHLKLSSETGKVTANKVMRDFRAAYNLAMRIADDPDELPDNPVKAVTFNKERSSNRVIMPDDLAHWWARVRILPNPLRRMMHELGLLSGLRPGTLVSIQREWVQLDNQAIVIPKMKSGRSFSLPLSNHMVEVVGQAMDLGQMLFPEAVWLFPTRNKHGEVIATQVWKEKTLPSETGHILRHTYRTVAQRIGIDPINARLLLDHTVQGIDGVYVHKRALFDKLLGDQERMTAELLELMAYYGRKAEAA